MSDEFQTLFPWINNWIKNPLSDYFNAASTEYAILSKFSKEWGKRDTVELLKELSAEYGKLAGRTVEKYAKMNTIKDWVSIGKKEAHEGTEMDDLIRVLWNPFEGA